MLNSSTMNYCSDNESAMNATALLTQALFNFTKTNFQCLRECSNVLYINDLSQYHENKLWKKNQFINVSSKSASIIAFSYVYISEKKLVETFFYDFSSMLGTAGGFLSLALGFSCLCSMKIMLRLFEKRSGWSMQK